MKKVYLKENYNRYLMFLQDLYIDNPKKFKLKMLDNLPYSLKILWSYYRDSELGRNMYKSFFPVKFESLVGTNYTTNAFFFDFDEKKVRWNIVTDSGTERCFKVKTNNFLERTEIQRKQLKEIIKKQYDSICGLWYDEDTQTLTDKNIVKDGKYRIIKKNVTRSDLIFVGE